MYQQLTSAAWRAIDRLLPSWQAALTSGSKRLATVRYARPSYVRTRRLISSTEYHSQDQLQELQLSLLTRIVNIAWNHSTGYREFWQDFGFHPRQLQTIADLQRIPVVTKEILRANIDAFSIRRPMQRRIETSTSGSGGVPLRFFTAPEIASKEWAFLHDLWSRRGFSLGQRAVVVRGKIIDGTWAGCENARIVGSGDLYLSSYGIRQDTVGSYANAIEAFNPDHIRAYPSALTHLTQFLIRVGIRIHIPALKCLILASEKTFEWQATLLRRYWNVPLIPFYGMSERVILAGPCERSDDLHAYPQYGIVESLPNDNGSPQSQELIGTSFVMTRTPFIRYRTGDIGRVISNYCEYCGRSYPILGTIDGRKGEFVIAADGSVVPFSMAVGGIHDDLFSPFAQFQFRQVRPGELIFYYIPEREVGEPEENRVAQEIKARIGDSWALVFRRVNNIEREPSGKVTFFRSELWPDASRV